MHNGFMLPFNIHGGTDVILVKRIALQVKLLNQEFAKKSI
jgi:hypothetical protein